MKILMLAWDFVPYFSPGLDCASAAVLEEFENNNFAVDLFLPYDYKNKNAVQLTGLKPIYHEKDIKNADEEIDVYTSRAKSYFKKRYFDAIYCGSWLAYRAALEAKKFSGRPLVVYAKNTSFNNKFNSLRYKSEKEAFAGADRIIVPAESIKKILNKKYNIQNSKISLAGFNAKSGSVRPGDKNSVLFMANNIKQKDAEYFMRIAKCVISHSPDTVFNVVFAKDNLKLIVERAISFGISDRIKYANCSTHRDIGEIISRSGIILVPNSSETSLNMIALNSGMPAVVDRNSEIRGMFRNIVVTDFWNTKETSDRIISLMRHSELFSALSSGIFSELKNKNNDFAEFISNEVKAAAENG